MPWVPYSLQAILDSPCFSPHDPPDEVRHMVQPPTFGELSRTKIFELLTKAIIYQIVLAIEYLHTHEPNPVAHRDIKPRNILLTSSGRVQLIDFGIAWQPTPAKDDIWSETQKMYFEVGSGCVHVTPALINVY